ncbi:MAG: MaoC/PaaZ C-terminal domain-containing protein [Rubrivivax sp.]
MTDAARADLPPLRSPSDLPTGTIDDVKVGEGIAFEKTVGESDVYLFAGITGDFAPNHVNERYMKSSVYGSRIAHGALVLAYTSTVAANFALERKLAGASLGYDRVRFIKPVYVGDTVRVEYRIARVDRESGRTWADVTVSNQHGQLVLACQHLLKILPYGKPAPGGPRAAEAA